MCGDLAKFRRGRAQIARHPLNFIFATPGQLGEARACSSPIPALHGAVALPVNAFRDDPKLLLSLSRSQIAQKSARTFLAGRARGCGGLLQHDPHNALGGDRRLDGRCQTNARAQRPHLSLWPPYRIDGRHTAPSNQDFTPDCARKTRSRACAISPTHRIWRNATVLRLRKP